MLPGVPGCPLEELVQGLLAIVDIGPCVPVGTLAGAAEPLSETRLHVPTVLENGSLRVHSRRWRTVVRVIGQADAVAMLEEAIRDIEDVKCQTRITSRPVG